jgi:hypothetical protein
MVGRILINVTRCGRGPQKRCRAVPKSLTRYVEKKFDFFCVPCWGFGGWVVFS